MYSSLPVQEDLKATKRHGGSGQVLSRVKVDSDHVLSLFRNVVFEGLQVVKQYGLCLKVRHCRAAFWPPADRTEG